MTAQGVNSETLKGLEPMRAFSMARLAELAGLSIIEHVPMNKDPFRGGGTAGQTVYLICGELSLSYADRGTVVLVGGSDEARFPIGRRGGPFSNAKAITDIDLLRIDDDLLDIMSTWEQIGEGEPVPGPAGGPPANWAMVSGTFSASSLKYEAFSQLPAANVDELLKRFERIAVKAGDVIIREDDEGDYYYVIESGKCRVERQLGGATVNLAELKSGDAFGEEALVSDAKRNATVTMNTEGDLLRLDKKEFIELLKEPLVQKISMDEALQRIAMGGQWVDVRYPSEFQYDGLVGAINIPLSEVRSAIPLLDRQRDYVVYCQSERRSSAAAFLLAQRGLRAYMLAGGLWNSVLA